VADRRLWLSVVHAVQLTGISAQWPLLVSGKPGEVREFDQMSGESQENVKEKFCPGKLHCLLQSFWGYGSDL